MKDTTTRMGIAKHRDGSTRFYIYKGKGLIYHYIL